jgi:hypothetical protein
MIFPAKEARSVDEKIHFVIFDFFDPGSKRSDRRYCEKNQKFEKQKCSRPSICTPFVFGVFSRAFFPREFSFFSFVDHS